MGETCADVEPLLSAWIDDELEPGERTPVESHLARCERCRRDAAGLARTRSLVGNLPARRLPADVDVQPSGAPSTGGRAEGPVRRTARAGIVGVVLAGFLLGFAYRAGDTAPDTRVVQVPVDAFVVDHLVHGGSGGPSLPLVVEAQR